MLCVETGINYRNWMGRNIGFSFGDMDFEVFKGYLGGNVL